MFENKDIETEDEYNYLYKKDDELNGHDEETDIMFGVDFLNCRIIHDVLNWAFLIILKV